MACGIVFQKMLNVQPLTSFIAEVNVFVNTSESTSHGRVNEANLGGHKEMQVLFFFSKRHKSTGVNAGEHG